MYLIGIVLQIYTKYCAKTNFCATIFALIFCILTNFSNVARRLRLSAPAEYAGAHAHHGAAAVHRYAIVVAHSPRALAEKVAAGKILLPDGIEQVGHRFKFGTNLTLVIHVRRHGHQAADAHMLQLAPPAFVKHGETLVGQEAVFGFLACHTHFKQNIRHTAISR